MPRKSRIHYQGALYHVIVRGNNCSNVFQTKKNKQEYLDIIKKYKNKYDFKLYAYCIMNNHAHLLIEVGEIPLSKCMQSIQQVYTQRYNKMYERTGHVFEQRYKGILCDKDSYLLNLIRYIHMNPVKANIEEGLEYKWSSHNEYLKEYEDSIVDSEFPLSIFSKNKNNRKKRYLEFITEKEIDEQMDYEIDEEKIMKYIKDIAEEKEFKISLDEIVKKTIEYMNISEEMLKSRNRKKNISMARRVIILLAKKYTNESNVLISEKIGVTKSLVSKVEMDLLKTNEELSENYSKISNEIIQLFKPDPD